MSDLNIDKLSLEIEASSDSAEDKIDKLAQSLERLKTVTRGISTRLDKINTSISNIGTGNAATGSVNKLNDSLEKLNRTSNNFSKTSNKAGDSASLFTSGFSKMSVATGKLWLAFKMGQRVIAPLFEESNSYVEALNLFEVAMGNTAQSALSYAETVQNAMGIDVKEWMDFQGTFNMMLKGFGTNSEAAQIMSQNLTQLAYDYASLKNVHPEVAFAKINSAMAGQIKGLKEYGNDVSVAAVKQTALKYGIDQAFASLDRNTQAFLRYQTIMENAANVGVFNDMARTIATPANAMRILNAQITQLKRALGNIVSVVATKVIPIFQVFVQLCTRAANALANLLGFKLPEIDYSGVDYGVEGAEDLADGLDSAAKNAKKLKDYTMGFDELNVINPNTGSGSVGSSFGSYDYSLDQLITYDFLDDLENKTNSVLERIQAKLTETFGPTLAIAWDGLKWFYTDVLKPFGEWTFNEAVPAFFDLLGATLRILDPFLQPIVDAFDLLWDNFLGPIASWTGDAFLFILNDIIDTFKDIAVWMDENSELVSEITEAIGLAVAVFASFEAVTWLANAAVAVFSTGLGATVGWIGVAIAAGALLYQNWDTICQWADILWTKIKEVFKAIGDFIGGIIQGLIDGFKGFVNSYIDGLNFLIRCVNSLEFDVPDWVPFVGGKKFDFNIDYIPRLANGGIAYDDTIVNVAEYSNSRSNPEVIAPLSKLKGMISDVTRPNVTYNSGSELSADDITVAVYTGFMQAMAEQPKDKKIEVYLDGNQISSSVRKNDAERGVSIFGDELGYSY